ncbi:maleylpyruvate isomerase family mycothiol-dependent enzyme [Streptomyces sp. NPDC094032]|uniref:maleylpyruvate isomerase family mycothiol-dependent enzyme n=1 Tax=Streptomyces sp. NPDC094032 TaxID=3155308 RepID=UPI003333B237
MDTLSTDTHIDALDTAGKALLDAATSAGTDAEVPTCPGWRVRDLLRHTTTVHRWATAYVAEGRTSFLSPGPETDLDGDALLAYTREGHARLVEALRGAPEDLECWTFLPAPSPRAFWARRQNHETTVHRADAESALGAGPGHVDPDIAADGIDELLRGFHGRDRSRVRTDRPRTLRIRTTDSDGLWTVHLSQDVPRTETGADGPADCELSGPADRLYMTLWNRLPQDAVTVTGDTALARLWRDDSAV